MLLLCAILPGKLPVWRLLSPAYYRSSETERTASTVLALVPRAASVVAQDDLTPHLSERAAIYTLRPGAPDADFVLAGQPLNPWPNDSWSVISDLLAERRAGGYRTVFEEGGFVLLRHPPEHLRHRHGARARKRR
jgi:hypothetical protein